MSNFQRALRIAREMREDAKMRFAQNPSEDNLTNLGKYSLAYQNVLDKGRRYTQA